MIKVRKTNGLWPFKDLDTEVYINYIGTVNILLHINIHGICLFVYLEFNVAFNTVQVISRRVVGRAEETST